MSLVEKNLRVGEILSFLDRRCSAKQFAAAPLALAVYRAIQRSVIDMAPLFRDKRPDLYVYAVPIRIESWAEPVIEISSVGRPQWLVHAPVVAEGLADQWSAACQHQIIVGQASCLFVVGISSADLGPNPYDDYRQAALGSGMVIGGMYRVADRLGVSTTSIGGFSDDAVAAALGSRSFLPLVAQAYGLLAIGQRKVDKARLVYGSTGSPTD